MEKQNNISEKIWKEIINKANKKYNLKFVSYECNYKDEDYLFNNDYTEQYTLYAEDGRSILINYNRYFNKIYIKIYNELIITIEN